MAEFPLLPIPTPEPDQRPPGPRRGNNLHLPGRARQGERLEPVFSAAPRRVQNRARPTDAP